MPLDFAISALLTLLVVVDPVGLVPTFLAVTEDLPRPASRSVAVRASLIAGAVLIGTAHAVDFAAGVPHRRRAPAVLDRFRNGVRRAHQA
jgi:small neutral amino acid transporter SnatA (MarC family)